MKTFQIYIYCILSYVIQCVVMHQTLALGSFLVMFCMGFDAVSVCVVEHQSLHYKAI